MKIAARMTAMKIGPCSAFPVDCRSTISSPATDVITIPVVTWRDQIPSRSLSNLAIGHAPSDQFDTTEYVVEVEGS